MSRIFLLPLLLSLTACVVRVAEPVSVVVDQPLPVMLTDGGTNSASQSVGRVQMRIVDAAAQMAQQLDERLKAEGIKRLAIGISRFVDLNAPEMSIGRGFGDELAEAFFFELNQRGYNVIDTRALPFADDDAARQLPELSAYYRQHRISYVLSGTYVGHSDGVTLHARVLDTVTRQVVAAAQSALVAKALEGSLPGYDPFSVRDGMIIENGGVPLGASPR